MGNAQAASPAPQFIWPGVKTRASPSFPQPNSCAPVLTTANVCYENGEFINLPVPTASNCCAISAGPNFGRAYVGGNCAGCLDGGCLGVVPPIASGQVYCKLDRYNADPFQCALTQINPQVRADNLRVTCDPAWLSGEGRNSLIRQYCSNGTNFLTDPRCTQFCTENDCTALVLQHCVEDRLLYDSCRFLCFSSQTDYDCRIALTTFCSEPANQAAEVCPCFLPTPVYDAYYRELFGEQAQNANLVISQINTLPHCSYIPCATSIYLPRDPRPCPDQAICVQKIELNADGDIIFNGPPQFQEDCRIYMGIGNDAVPTAQTFMPDWLVAVIIIVGIILLVVVVLLVYYAIVQAIKKRKNTI